MGGGVIGFATAYNLAREGESVTVVDSRATGLGASEVNAGWVTPACSSPVPGPGLILQSLKWMLKADSPLYIRPSADPALLSFMLTMWRRSNARDQQNGLRAHLRLAEGTMEAFDDYREDGLDFEMHDSGLLMAFREKESLDHHCSDLDIVRSFGLDPRVLVGDDLRAHEPLLSDAVYGGIFFPKERFLDPGALMRALRKRVEELGVTVVENAPIDRVDADGTVVTAVYCGSTRFTGDAYLLAAGAWTGPLSRLFGVGLPIRAGKGYSIEVAPLALRSATNLSDAKVAVTPFHNRLRLSGTMEIAGLDENINSVRVAAIARAPQGYFRDWTPVSGDLKPRAGIRPMSPDGLPIIGRLGPLKNAFVATGHGMLGVTLAPGTASTLSDLILHGRCSPALEPFSPKRFSHAHSGPAAWRPRSTQSDSYLHSTERARAHHHRKVV